MYKLVKGTLQKTGELMIKMSDGETFELHLHNIKFHDDKELIEIDGGDETYWLNGNEVIYMWIHRHAKED